MNSAEQSPSGGAKICSANQEIPHISWNPNDYYQAFETISKINSVLQILFYFLKIYLNIILFLCLILPSGFFPQVFWCNFCLRFSCPSYPHWFYCPSDTWGEVQILEVLTLQFYPASCCLPPLNSAYSCPFAVPFEWVTPSDNVNERYDNSRHVTLHNECWSSTDIVHIMQSKI